MSIEINKHDNIKKLYNYTCYFLVSFLSMLQDLMFSLLFFRSQFVSFTCLSSFITTTILSWNSIEIIMRRVGGQFKVCFRLYFIKANAGIDCLSSYWMFQKYSELVVIPLNMYTVVQDIMSQVHEFTHFCVKNVPLINKKMK